jgi:spore coat-associated protein N
VGECLRAKFVRMNVHALKPLTRAPDAGLAARGKPVARRGRKARGLTQTARLPVFEEDGRQEGAPQHGKGALFRMTRLQYLAHRPRRTLAALATVLVAVGITAASGASFTASSASPGNVFSTGTLHISSTKDNAAILTVGNMRPGDPASTGLVDIGNTGSLSGNFTLAHTTPNDSDTANPLSGKLNLVVADCGTFSGTTPPSCTGATPLYSGTLADMPGTPVSLGAFAGGVKHRYQFSVSLDSTADNAYQGDSSSTEFDFNAA